MKKRDLSDEDDKDVIAAYERGEFRPVKNQRGAKREAAQAAGRYMR